MPKSKTCLPDVNVWLALFSDRHVHYSAAAKWFQNVNHGNAAFCRITQMGLLRLLTRSSVMGVDVVSQAQAWNIYSQMNQDSRVRFLTEPPGVEDAWQKLTQSNISSPQSWTDAYLVAFAQARELELVSFDQGLKRFGDFALRILE